MVVSTDISFLQKLFKLSSWLGLTPLCFKETSTLKISYLRLWPLLMAPTCLVISSLAMLRTLREIPVNVINVVGIGLEFCINSFMMTICFMISSFRRSHWKRLLDLLQQFDHRNPQYNRRLLLYFVFLFTLIIMFFQWHYHWFYPDHFVLEFIIYTPINFTYLVATALQFIILDIVKFRYNYLNVILETATQEFFYARLTNLYKQYGTLYDIVEQLNAILGWSFLFTHIKFLIIPWHTTAYLSAKPSSALGIFSYLIDMLVSLYSSILPIIYY